MIRNIDKALEDFGKIIEPTSEHQKFIEEYTERFNESGADKALFQSSVIFYHGECGMPRMGGTRAFLQNMDTVQGYNLVIRVQRNFGTEHDDNTYRRIHIPAGGRVMLGCTVSDSFPLHTYSFQIVGIEAA